ncbi:hypothetical protein VTO73DRAFT_2358 [Trametes versicolor]
MFCTCQLCHAGGPTDIRFGDESGDTYHPGEVFCVLSQLGGDVFRRSRASLDSLRTRRQATKKIRPGVLLKKIDGPLLNLRHAQICLVATFESTPMGELPGVFQYFCLPIFPNGAVNCGKFHLHCIPDWTEPKSWIFAWVFETTRPLESRWLTEEEWAKKCRGGREDPFFPELGDIASGTPTGMAFGVDAVAELKKRCRALRQSWMQRCHRDRQFAIRHEKEYREFKEAQNAQPSSFVAHPSISPSRVLPSRRSGVITTIVEDQPNSFPAAKRSVAVDEWSTVSKARGNTAPSICPSEVRGVPGNQREVLQRAPAKKPHFVRKVCLLPSTHLSSSETSSPSQNLQKTTPAQSVASTTASRATSGVQNVFARFGNRFTALRKNSAGDA